MIAVERGPLPASLDDGESPGGEERRKAIEFFADPENREKAFAFKAYGKDDVKLALREMCGVKCAYCEADVRSGAPTDTEHFRPKAELELNDRRERPGYYWLAASWKNLLPSCRDCNSQRYQETAQGRRKTGKGNRFPLEVEFDRAMRPGEEVRERPYLLDPTVDDPEDHLEFLPEGSILPALDAQGAPSERGQVSIDLYGLDRIDLCTVREEQGIVIQRAIKHFKSASVRFQEHQGSRKAEKELEEELDELRRLVQPSIRFAALARQMIKRELGSLKLEMPK
jgi:uncharacterized protein (TIGR02646 family)